MRRIMFTVFFGLLACVITLPMVFGQGTSGTVSGTIKDGTGAVMPGAKVEIRNEDTGIVRTVETDSGGRYTAPSLGLGTYRVTATMQGFQTEARTGIELTVGREAVVNFELKVGAVSQTVEVTGEAPLVESTTSTMGVLVDDRTIRELPLNGRSYDQLALLQPGVVGLGASGTSNTSFDYGTGQRFSVAGSRMNANSFLLDGTDINDQANATPGGAAGTNLGVDGIREFKILTNTFSAEYGRSSGGVIAAVTRAGTNSLHGTLFEFLRNSVLDARNFFDPGVPPFRRNQFGGALGGPIKKDKTFFFGTYEGLRQGLGAGVIAFVPTARAKLGFLPNVATQVTINPVVKPFLALYPDPNGRDFGDGTGEFITAPMTTTAEDYFMARVDHQFSEKMNLFGRYSFDRDANINPEANNLPGVLSTRGSRRQYSTVQLSNILTPALLNNFTLAYNRSFQSSDDETVPRLGPEYSFIPGLEMGTIQFGASSATAGAPRTVNNLGTTNGTPRNYAYNLFEVDDGVTYVKGKHSLKVGGQFKRIRDNTAENTSLRGVYTFPTFEAMLRGQASALEAVQPGQHAYRGYRQSIYGVYVQDDVKFSSRLTANIGFRWEATNDPEEVNGKSSMLVNPTDPQLTITKKLFSVTKKGFEPRVGLAWQANSKGSTVVRSGFGVYHDHVLPGIYALNLAKDPPFYSLLNANNPSFPNGIPNLAGSLARLILVSPFVKEPTTVRYNLNVQQQLFNDMLIEVAYIGSTSSHLWLFSEVNYIKPLTFVDGMPIFPTARTAPRLNPNFDSSRNLSTDGNASYNAVQITARRRSLSGVQYQVFYTFSKAMDTKSAYASADSAQEPNTTMNPFNHQQDRALTYFNAGHNFGFNTSYPLPFKFQSKAASFVMGGWTLNGIGSYSSGRPFTARVGSNQSNSGDRQTPDRPNLLPGKSNNPVLGGPNKYFDATVFSLPAAGTLGNLGRNTIIGPGIVNFDASVEKNFAATERLQVRFRAEFFNIFNHANFGLPASNVFTTGTANISGSAGRITSTTTRGRQIQFGLKITF